MTKPLIAAACILLAVCNASAASLTPDEQKLVAAIGMDANLAAQLTDDTTTLERLKGVTSDGDAVDVDGLLLSVKPNTGERALADARAQIHGTTFRAYLYDRGYGYGVDKIAIVRTDDLGYLAIVRTDGTNHDITHEQIVARYTEWNAKYGLALKGAGLDWLEAKLRTPPPDWPAFAKEVATFCPGVVDQGTGDVATLAKEMAEANSVYCWWD